MALTQQRLKELLNYNAETGLFSRVSEKGTGHYKPVSLRKNTSGYTSARVDTNRYPQHRLAWLYVYGEWPNGQIDHINGDRSDNRIANLRDVTCSINSQNQRAARRDNSLGVLGVYKKVGRKGAERYIATLFIDGKNKQLGTFDTKEEAAHAYVSAKRIHHAGCTI